MNDCLHTCEVDGCVRPTWEPPPAFVALPEADCQRRPVTLVCPCYLCNRHVSIDEVVVVDGAGHVSHYRCVTEVLNEIEGATT